MVLNKSFFEKSTNLFALPNSSILNSESNILYKYVFIPKLDNTLQNNELEIWFIDKTLLFFAS